MSEQRANIHWANTAAEALRAIGSQTVRQKLYAKVEDLLRHEQPESIGKPMRDELQGYYRITFGRYRILYRVARSSTNVAVEVALVGIRKEGDKSDIYRVAQRLRRQGRI